MVWGSSVKHNPQKVGREHVLKDEDVVQIIKKCAHFLFRKAIFTFLSHCSVSMLFLSFSLIFAACFFYIFSLLATARQNLK